MKKVKAKRISPGCCTMDQDEVYEGILEDSFYFNPLVYGEYQGDHWIEGHWEIINDKQSPTPEGGKEN